MDGEIAWFGITVAVSEYSLEFDDVVVFGIVTARGVALGCRIVRSMGLKEGDGSGGGMTLISFAGVVSFSRVVLEILALPCDDRSSLILLELIVGILLSAGLFCVRVCS